MKITSRTEHAGKPRQIISVDAKHTLYADLGSASGGEGSAPGAHDYFDVALAICKAQTAFVYAKARGIALDRVTAEVVRDDSQERQGTYVLDVKLTFEGALSEAEKLKMADVLNRCPIHKLMTTTTVEIRQSLTSPT
jgi:putative redox protein